MRAVLLSTQHVRRVFKSTVKADLHTCRSSRQAERCDVRDMTDRGVGSESAASRQLPSVHKFLLSALPLYMSFGVVGVLKAQADQSIS